jgi:hypothetical protein
MPLTTPQRSQLSAGLGLGALFFVGFLRAVISEGFTAQAGLMLAGALVFAGLGALAWTRFAVSK